MSATASILMSVFDELEYGLVVLDKDFQARSSSTAPSIKCGRCLRCPISAPLTTLRTLLITGVEPEVYITAPASC